jgi:integrase
MRESRTYGSVRGARDETRVPTATTARVHITAHRRRRLAARGARAAVGDAGEGGKIGARLGELFRKRLESLGLNRERLCFHSFRHTVAGALEAAAVSQTDAARVLGHKIAGMSYGTYSSGPGLKRLAAVVEEIAYPGLRL